MIYIKNSQKNSARNLVDIFNIGIIILNIFYLKYGIIEENRIENSLLSQDCYARYCLKCSNLNI